MYYKYIPIFKTHALRPVFQKQVRHATPFLPGPDIRLGKTVVHRVNQCVNARALNRMRWQLKRIYGKDASNNMCVFPTVPRTDLPIGLDKTPLMGPIRGFYARVSAGQVVAHIPRARPSMEYGTALPDFRALRMLSHFMSGGTVIREQQNNFPQYSMETFLSGQRAHRRAKLREASREAKLEAAKEAFAMG